MINAKCKIVTSNQGKVLPIPLRCMRVLFLKVFQEDDSSDIYYVAFVVLLL